MAIRYHSPSLSCLYKLVGDVFKLFDAVDCWIHCEELGSDFLRR